MIRLAAPISDGCVLPLGTELRLRGQTDLEGGARISLLDRDGTPLVTGTGLAASGLFTGSLAAISGDGSGLTLVIDCAGERTVVRNVALGLVFLAGGQSNMELPLCNAGGGAEEVSTHDDPDLRWYMVPKESRADRAAEARKQCRWEPMTPGSSPEMSAVAYFFAKRLREQTGSPVGIIGCYWGGTSIASWITEEGLRSCVAGRKCLAKWQREARPMTMDEWQEANDRFMAELNAWNDSVAGCRGEQPGIAWKDIERLCGPCPWHPPLGPGSPYRPGGLAETMVGFTNTLPVNGILYYQGESDAYMLDSGQYRELLELLAREWRRRLDCPDALFLNVQLPVYEDQPPEGWAYIRRAQARARIPDSALVCTVDTGERDNIHPTEKTAVGFRLADTWLAMRAGDGRPLPSPRIIASAAVGDTLVLTCSRPLRAPEGGAKHFELQDEEGVWHPAAARVDGARITLTSPGVTPVDYRYAWFNWGRVNVFGTNGVPLMPD